GSSELPSESRSAPAAPAVATSGLSTSDGPGVSSASTHPVAAVVHSDASQSAPPTSLTLVALPSLRESFIVLSPISDAVYESACRADCIGVYVPPGRSSRGVAKGSRRGEPPNEVSCLDIM